MKSLSKPLMTITGGALLVIGSLMTWISVDVGFQAFSSKGTEIIEGKLTLAAGVMLVIAGALVMRGIGPVAPLNWLLGAAAVFSSIVLVMEYIDVQNRIAEAAGTPATATIGGGVWIAAIGAAVALSGTAWALVGQRSKVAPIPEF